MKRHHWLLALAASACFAQTYSDPKARAIDRVCVLPAEARLVRVGMKGGESLTAESAEWSAKLGNALRHAVVNAGGELNGDFSPEALKDDQAARESLLHLRQKYESVSVQMRKKRRGVKSGRYTLGDEVLLLPCAAQADAVAFIDATGTIQTGSRKALSIVTGGFLGILLAMSEYDIWISFADAKTGEITTLLRLNSLGGKAGKDPDEALKKTLVARLKKLHMGSASRLPVNSAFRAVTPP